MGGRAVSGRAAAPAQRPVGDWRAGAVSGGLGGVPQISRPYAVVRDVLYGRAGPSVPGQTVSERSVGRIGAGRSLAPVR